MVLHARYLRARFLGRGETGRDIRPSRHRARYLLASMREQVLRLGLGACKVPACLQVPCISRGLVYLGLRLTLFGLTNLVGVHAMV